MKKVEPLKNLYIFILCFSFCCSLLLEIDNIYGSDSPSCLTDHGPPCSSLEFISQNYPTTVNLTLTIVSPMLILTSLVSLSNVSNFTLQGLSSDNTTIVCEQKHCSPAFSDGAGIRFTNLSFLNLLNFSMKNCSFNANVLVHNDFHGLLIMESRHILIHNVKISHSFGYGLSLFNINGSVSINNCSFEWNQYRSHCGYRGGASGLLIYINSPNKAHEYRGQYLISQCRLHRNVANIKNTSWGSSVNHGGGMHLLLKNGAVKNVINISNCVFSENAALLGGGFYLTCKSGCERNNFSIFNTIFKDNTASVGGGGMDLGYSINRKSDSSTPVHNKFACINCSIIKNTGLFGGGVAIFTSDTFKSDSESNEILFQSCCFKGNKANGGAAVDINRDEITSIGSFFIANIYFRDCSFVQNVAGSVATTSSAITQSGAFFTSKVIAKFEGNTTFQYNQGSALYVSGTEVVFRNSFTKFKQNSGERGGAILLVGEATLNLEDENHFEFYKNTASYGGAVCAVISETRYFLYTDSCFLKMSKKHHGRNSFVFENNIATTGIAHDIFVSNLYPCRLIFNCKSLISVFRSECLGNFTFSHVNESESFATATSKILVDQEISAIPGIPLQIDIIQQDQFNTSVGKLFPLSAYVNASSLVKIDTDYVILRNNEILLKGMPGTNFSLTLQSNTIAVIKVSTSVSMLECPPGFSFDENKRICDCSQNLYISYCAKQRVTLKEGNWAGYIGLKVTGNFAVGGCEYNLCNFNNAKPNFSTFLLPSEPEKLESSVCGANRRGILCGLCANRHTVYYHSPTFRCGKAAAELCSYGAVFYILTEIIPTTILFLVVIIFNIHLTSGLLYSFIFYTQSLDVLNIDAFGAIRFGASTKTVLELYKVVYGIFNLKFLNVNSISFCLREDMNVMDSLIIQYLTIIYALFLILVTLLILKINSLYSCIKLCHRCGRRNIRGSVINGLTAFIVLCYFKCIEITYKILIPVYIVKNGVHFRTVALFNGELEYLKQDHLNYAIPAFICLFVIILPPPVLLLSESLLMMLNRYSKIKRNFLTYFLHRIRLKALPFLDSFQGCFRDNCRCFAGLFFIYRICLLCPYFFSGRVSHDYISALIILFVILIVHSFCHPFQNSWHNKFDIFLLIDLILVNMLTLFHYQLLVSNYIDKQMEELILFIQTLLITVSMITVTVCTVYQIATKINVVVRVKEAFFRKFKKPKEHSNTESVIEKVFPYRLLEDTFGSSSGSKDSTYKNYLSTSS